jgi:hypothetical protein
MKDLAPRFATLRAVARGWESCGKYHWAATDYLAAAAIAPTPNAECFMLLCAWICLEHARGRLSELEVS